jgi:hypothetical protein
VKIKHPTKLSEYCYSDDASTNYFSAGIYAIKVAHLSGGSAPVVQEP